MHSDTCGLLIKQIHDAVGRQLNNSLRRKGLTLAQVRILMELGKNNGTVKSLKELERCFRVAQSTIVGIIRRLEAKGLVQGCTDPCDNRVKLVRLTPEGEAFRKTNKKELELMEKRMLSGLSETQRREFLKILRIVYDNIK